MQVTAGTIAAKGQGKSNAVVVEGDKDQEQSKDKKLDEMANQGYDDVPAHRNPVCSHWKSWTDLRVISFRHVFNSRYCWYEKIQTIIFNADGSSSTSSSINRLSQSKLKGTLFYGAATTSCELREREEPIILDHFWLKGRNMKPVEGQSDCDWLNFPTIMIHSNIVRHHCFVLYRHAWFQMKFGYSKICMTTVGIYRSLLIRRGISDRAIPPIHI